MVKNKCLLCSRKYLCQQLYGDVLAPERFEPGNIMKTIEETIREYQEQIAPGTTVNRALAYVQEVDGLISNLKSQLYEQQPDGRVTLKQGYDKDQYKSLVDLTKVRLELLRQYGVTS